jgi:hypothetical protein
VKWELDLWYEMWDRAGSQGLAAWLLFPLLVGLRNTLDAGCAFMLILVGVMLVVGLAHNGPGYLLP